MRREEGEMMSHSRGGGTRGREGSGSGGASRGIGDEEGPGVKQNLPRNRGGD